MICTSCIERGFPRIWTIPTDTYNFHAQRKHNSTQHSTRSRRKPQRPLYTHPRSVSIQPFTSLRSPSLSRHLQTFFFFDLYDWPSGYMFSFRLTPSSSRMPSSSCRYSSYWLLFSTFALMPALLSVIYYTGNPLQACHDSMVEGS